VGKTRRGRTTAQKPPPPHLDPNLGQAQSGERDLADLAEDWIALWQSELSALATDRETQENWHTLLALWGSAASIWLRTMSFGRADAKSRPTPSRAPTATTRAPAPAAAPDVRDVEIDRLHSCIAELERRLADVERRAGKPATDRRSTGRVGRKR